MHNKQILVAIVIIVAIFYFLSLKKKENYILDEYCTALGGDTCKCKNDELDVPSYKTISSTACLAYLLKDKECMKESCGRSRARCIAKKVRECVNNKDIRNKACSSSEGKKAMEKGNFDRNKRSWTYKYSPKYTYTGGQEGQEGQMAQFVYDLCSKMRYDPQWI